MKFEEAARLIEQSLSITPQTDRFGIAFGLGFLGMVRLYTGHFAEAESPLRLCLALHRELGMRGFGLHWGITLGLSYLHLGRYAAAESEAERMIAEGQEISYPRGIRLGLGLLGQVGLVEGAWAQADDSLRESQCILEQDAGSQQEAGLWAWLGLAARGLGQREQAWQHFAAGLEAARRAHQFMPLMTSLAGIALLLADEGQGERAVELYALVSGYPFVGNSCWFEEAIGQHIAVAAADLPPEIVDAARQRGQTLHLEATVVELLAELGDRA
jgi:tetratricopeptide (TPR) repeat protein